MTDPILFIASKEVAFGERHLYFYYDADGDLMDNSDAEIIRGGQLGNYLGSTGSFSVLLEIAKSASDSADRLDIGESLDDRGMRELFSGTTATAVWGGLQSILSLQYQTGTTSVADLYTSSFTYNYAPSFEPNSNSTVSTLLNLLGIDLADVLPYVPGTSTPYTLDVFPGKMGIMDGSLDETYTAFANVNGNYTFLDRAGSDAITIEQGARLTIINDTDASESNSITFEGLNIALQYVDVRQEFTGVSFVDTDDLVVGTSGVALNPEFAVLLAGDQYAGNGLAADSLEFRSSDGATILKSINLDAIAELEAFGNLSEIYTAFDSTLVSLGNIVDGSSLSDQTDRLFGLDGQDDILTGSLGDDIIKGGTGTDEYVWRLGDGSDTIYDDWADSDVLSLGAGITRSMITLDTTGSDLEISIAPGVFTSLTSPGYGGLITIKGQATAISTFLSNHVTGIVPDLASYVPATGGTITSTLPNETLFGFGTNDEMIGQGGDTLYGGGGDDTLSGASTQYGEGDNDWLSGGSVMDGGDGNDRINAYSGATIADGGAGNDTIIATGASGLGVDGGDDDDFIKVDGTSFTVLGGTGDDIISVSATSNASVNGGDDNDIIHYRVNGSSATSTYTVSDGDDIIYRSHDWTLTLDFTGVTISDSVYVNERDLLLTHSLGTLLLVGYTALDKDSWYILDGSGTRLVDIEAATADFSTATTDVVFYGGGSMGIGNYALITTGSGNDYIETSDAGVEVQAGIGQDVVVGGTGNDEIYGGLDIDNLSGGDGNDDIYGEEGDDTLSGGAGNDTIEGGDGDDVIDGGAGSNILYGGAGNDTITVSGSGDMVYGGDGNDTIHATSYAMSIYGGSGNDIIDGGSDAQNIYGEDGDDEITAGAQNDYIEGGAGNDIIDGGAGSNTIYGDDGDDEITVVTSSDSNTIYGGNGADFIVGGSGGNTLYGDAGDDQLVGGASMDQIYGGDGNDELTGNDGNDTLEGNAGNDEIYGDGGNDTIEGGDGNDTLYGGADGDTIRGGIGADYLNGGADNDYLYGEAGDDNIQAGDGDDYVDTGAAGSPTGNTVSGGAGHDTLIGGGNKDTIDGGDDNDVIYGNGGNDALSGGSGNDTIYSGDGTDSVYGDDGDDILRGNGTGLKTVHGGAGNDNIGIDSLTNNHLIQGGDGDDTIETNDGNDTIYGDDSLDAFATGNDVIDSRGGGNYILDIRRPLPYIQGNSEGIVPCRSTSPTRFSTTKTPPARISKTCAGRMDLFARIAVRATSRASPASRTARA